MTQEESIYYENLKDNPSFNDYVFDKLFTTINGITVAKPNVALKLVGGIPLVYNTFTSNNVFDNLFPNNLNAYNQNSISQGLSNPNSIEKNATQYALNIPFSENSIFHPNFDIKRKEEEEMRIFEVVLERSKTYKTLVPLGINDFKNNYEPYYIAFNYSLNKSDIDELTFNIYDQEESLIYSVTYLKPIIIENKTKLKKNSFNNPIADSNLLIPNKNYPFLEKGYTEKGKYILYWDGFDNDGIYDSTRFNNKKFKAKIIATKGNVKKSKEVTFSTTYSEVNWVDVKINIKTKIIDTTLRVNLKNGGAEGLTCINHTEDEKMINGEPNTFYGTTVKICPWDKISQEALNKYKKTPITTRNKSFEELEKLVLEGINKFWSRNNSNIGKGIKIDGKLFEVNVNAISNKNGIIAPEIIYQTNTEPGRSRNFILSRKLFYSEGYLYYSNWKELKPNHPIYISKGWKYPIESFDLRFKETSAHEIGHELLINYGGPTYSYQHKGTSGPTWLFQDPLDGTKYPTGTDEIDIMKYADEIEPENYFKRVVLSEKDLLGLIWLSKIKIFSFLLSMLLICSCTFFEKKKNKSKIETVDYYNGVVVDENNKAIKDVKITGFNDYTGITCETFTDNKGYFEIKEKMFKPSRLHSEDSKLIFFKKGFIIDTFTVCRTGPNYNRFEINCYFSKKKTDTMLLIKIK